MATSAAADAPARLRRPLVRAGWLAAVVIAVGTVVDGLPEGSPASVAVVALTIVALTGWIASLDDRLVGLPLVAALLATGLAGAALDLIHPSGPGFILAFMAMAGLGLRVPRRAAIIGGGIVLAAASAAEALTSEHPVSAALNLAMGAGFLLLATAFAAANRDARARAEELLRAQQEAKAATERAAVLSERSRLARELHDILAHTMSGLSVQLEGARLMAEHTSADPRLVQQIAAAQVATRSGLVNARQAVATLRGDRLPGWQDVAELVEQARLRGLVATMTVVGEPHAVSGQTDLTLYRCVQESLTNATKHAGPGSHVAVTVTWSDEAVVVEVVDDGGGRGPRPAAGRRLRTGRSRRAGGRSRRALRVRPARAGVAGPDVAAGTVRRGIAGREGVRWLSRLASSSRTTRRSSARASPSSSGCSRG